MNDLAKKLPPFAKHLDPNDEFTMIYCGTRAWELATPVSPPKGDRVASLAYPRDADPQIYKWPVKDKDVLIIAGDENAQKVGLLVIELIRQGAFTVHVYRDNTLVTYDRPAP